MTVAISHIDTQTDRSVVALPDSGVMLLMQLKCLALRNLLYQVIREQPLKLIGVGGSILLIWGGLYKLLVKTFEFVHQSVLEGIVATPLIFTFFFLALTAMLAFSNAIISYGSLFRQAESAYLAASPLRSRDVVIVKYLESLILSSWSLLLLGLPLMMALAYTFAEPWSFYPLFLGIFLLFIPLPGAIGLLLAWLVAMIFPKTPRRMIILAGLLVVAAGAWWLWGIVSQPITSSLWLKNFYDRVSLVQNAMLPHTWVSKGINYAVQGQPASAAFYLFVTLANALFASMVAVVVVSRGYASAFARAQTSGAKGVRKSGRLISWFAEILFAYLPHRQRLLAVKDLKSFFRDPLQWSQMAILFGLLALYVSNAQRLWMDLANPGFQVLIAFLNLTAVSLILATFTSRFVFPLVSLEGQQLWLLGLLPLPRSWLVISKFLYALTITLVAALVVMSVSVQRLSLSPPLMVAHLVSIAAICVGLCGISIGVGARMPVFTERNPARIAGGFGGTVSLLLSIGLVVASLAAMGSLSMQAVNDNFGDTLTGSMVAWLVAVVIVNAAVAVIALVVGIRHFNRIEC